MKRMILAAMSLAFAVVGCADEPPPEDAETFWEALAVEKCSYWHRCLGDDFDLHYPDEYSCQSSHYSTQGTPAEFADACPDYVPEEGQICLEYVSDHADECDRPPSSRWDDNCGHVCGTFGVEHRVLDDGFVPVGAPH